MSHPFQLAVVARRGRARLGAACAAGIASLGLVATIGTAEARAYTLLCNQSGIGCISHTGYAGTSTWAYPVDGAGNNCTNYAAFRLSRNGAANPGNLGNAGSWASNARAKGFRVDGTAAVGAIAQWNYGHSYSPTYGHVAYVEEVTPHDILLSDSNWQGGSKRWRVRPSDRQWPSNFLHIRDVGGSTPPGPAPGSPFGHVDHLSGAAGGHVQINGWTVDPDGRELSGSVHVYIDGPAGAGRYIGQLDAANTRPDVAQAVPGAGDAHGFSGALGHVATGRHSVYVYAINRAGGGDNPLLGSGTVDVPALASGSPFGSFDEATGRVGARARLRAWTIDPDARTLPTSVHAYVDGPAGSGAWGVDLGAAEVSRPDVAAAHAGAGEWHGLDTIMERLPAGRHTIWLYAINRAGGGENPLLSTRTVVVPGSTPYGSVDHVAGIAGHVQLTGWTFDPDVPNDPSEVHVYIGGPAGSGARAVAVPSDLTRLDVARAYPGVSAEHGYQAAIQATPGTYPVYVYAINRGIDGGNPLIGSATVTVPAPSPGSPFGSFDSATGGALAARLTGWTVDPDARTTSTDVHAYVNGPAGSGARGVNLGRADKSRPDVSGVVDGAGDLHGLDTELGGLEEGRHGIWLYAINAAGNGENPLLGVKTVTVTGAAPRFELSNLESPQDPQPADNEPTAITGAGRAPVPAESTGAPSRRGARGPRQGLTVRRSGGKIKLSWTPIAGARGYRVRITAGPRTVRRTVVAPRLSFTTRRRRMRVRITTLARRDRPTSTAFRIVGTTVRRVGG